MTEPENDGSNVTIAKDQLKSLVERIERLEEEKKEVGAQIKEVYDEAKGNGFDVQTIRKVIKLRKIAAEERSNQQAMLDMYMQALGMLGW